MPKVEESKRDDGLINMLPPSGGITNVACWTGQGDETKTEKFHLLPANLGDLALAATKYAGARFATSGIMVKVDREGHYCCEATTHSILARVTGPMDDAKGYPPVPALESAPNGEATALIPADAWKKAFAEAKKIKRHVKPILGNVALAMGKDQATMVSTDLEKINVSQQRLLEGRWPRTDEELARGKPVLTFCIEAGKLAALLAIAASIAKNDEGDTIVTVEWRGEGKSMVLRARNDSGQEFTGAVMPLESKVQGNAKD